MADMNMKGGSGDKQGMTCPVCGGSGTMAGHCCGEMGWHHHGGFGWKIVRIIVGLILLGIVFSLGVLVGEFKVIVGDAGYGYGRTPMMRGYFNYDGNVPTQSYYPMMGGYGQVRVVTSTNP